MDELHSDTIYRRNRRSRKTRRTHSQLADTTGQDYQEESRDHYRLSRRRSGSEDADGQYDNRLMNE